jgi:uncharacterized protein YecT (DUF1311 family)
MGKWAFLAAVVVALVAPSAPKPPKISEGFTLLPCTAMPTTLSLEGCAERRVVRSDAAIDRRVERIFSLLRTRNDRAAQIRFVRGENAWLRYRRVVCASRADVYEGGSAALVVFGECEADVNDAHLRELRSFERVLRRR